MRQIIGLLFFFLLTACSDTTQKTNTNTIDTTNKITDAIKSDTIPAISKPYSFDTAYEIAREQKPLMVTGYFNTDNLLDTAIVVRHKSTMKDALFINHGGTNKSFLLRKGNDVGSDFDDFNWVGQFEVIKKGTKVWNNVIDGEIVGNDQVPENKKFTLQTDSIFVHEDEGGGGGIIYFKNGKYVWAQQD